MSTPRGVALRLLLSLLLLASIHTYSWSLGSIERKHLGGKTALFAYRRAPSAQDDSHGRQPYWEDEASDWNETPENYVDEEVYDELLQPDVFEWERCPTDAGTAHVLLPPPSVGLPTAVLHFTGGTFFGSAPSLWYRQLLEDIVRHTQAAVIATSIPVTLLNSPLNHIRLAKKLKRQFQFAWREVLLDEYGEDIETIPHAAMGHSLGSRLLVVLATLGEGQSSRSFVPPPYKSFILISFANYAAGAGIPGIYQLNKVSRRMERNSRTPDDEWTRSKSRSRRSVDWLDDEDYDDEDYDDDVEWGEIFQELQQGLRKQAARVQGALTPASDELEFYPTPKALWQAIEEGRRYNVPRTLVVQFDDDEVDQSAKLASAIKGTSDVKFARLRGTHLTPVSAKKDASRGRNGGTWLLDQVNSKAGRLLWKVVAGRRQSRPNEEAIRELRSTIARYTTEVITK